MADELKITNLIDCNKYIFLFPIRNFDFNIETKLKHYILILTQFPKAEILILDKTKTGDIKNYLNNQFDDISKIKFMKRPFNESTFDSQKLIKLDKKCWILQIHEDDSVEELPEFFKIEYTEKDTILLKVLNHFKDPLENNNPNRYIFSFIPSNIWNLFVEYLRIQNTHISYSADAILSDLVIAFSKKFYYSKVKYIYTDRWNFLSNFNRNSHAVNLSKFDGWSILSNKFIFIFNARMEFLIYLKYFSTLYECPYFFNKLNNALIDIKNTYRFKYLWIITYYFFNKVINFKYIQNVSYFTKIKYTSLIIYKCISIQEPTDLISLIKCLRNIPHLNLLYDRFDFWNKILRT